jgi:hypothetical protein
VSERKVRRDHVFEKLLGDYYGSRHLGVGPPASRRWLPGTSDELLAGYYGKRHRHAQAGQVAPVSVASSLDDGETLTPRARAFEEYVVARSLGDATIEEYVVERIPADSGTTLGMSLAEPPPDPRKECQVDLLNPLATGADGQIPPAPARAAEPPVPAAAAPARPAALPAAPPAAAAALTRTTAQREASAPSDDDFMADMQSILTGQSVYDPVAKQTVRKDVQPAPKAPQAGTDTSNAQDIFDKLAASMQYANAYDLGTVELENRFADFDMLDDVTRKEAEDKKQRKAPPPAAKGPAVGSEEFIEDMDAIHRGRDADRAAAERPGLSESASIDPGLSRFMFDTGEHVLVAGDAYVDQLRVGANPGVSFSYGELIAMGDLFESVDQMMGADPAQLKRIKALIDRSAAYYAEHKADPTKDVSDDERDAVTGHRYLKLAEMNFEHFSPNFLFRRASFASLLGAHGDNKSTWEKHHARAISEAQAVGLARPNDKSVRLPLEWPLIINAFGDHFLTDAFSSGHLINKEAIVELWKSMFFKSGALTADAKAFFKRLAEKAFKNAKVKKAFSALETVKSYYVFFHPSINSAERFGDVLAGIAEKEPDRIANMCVKAIHDRLNRDGVEVTNDAGDGTWTLYGDGHLDDKNRKIIQRGVEQSIANINDPSILVSNIDLPSYLGKVWKHVPKLSAASEAKVQRIVNEYVTPSSTVLVDAASDIIERKVDLLVKELIAAKALKPA